MSGNLPPQLSLSIANTVCAILTATFVGSFYLFRGSLSHSLSRNDPRVIRRRFLAAAGTCCFGFVLVMRVLLYIGAAKSLSDIWPLIGIRTRGLFAAIIFPLLLAVLLFLGPLSVDFAEKTLPLQKYSTWARDFRDGTGDILIWRNYVVGPLAEEIVFRSYMVAMYQAAGVGMGKTVFLSPMFFGFAHLHHGLETYRNNGRTSAALRQASLQVALQFFYTTLFGWFSTFVYIRTGHLIAAVIPHMFCNLMGFPDFGAVMEHQGGVRIALIGCYLLGMVLFGVLLFPATTPDLYQ
ncbi:hypothetical protein DFS34DRAFT_160677 [Phlyctochytrium arcticum]|nr:hypothetical protein DFS34DRAFT_160677 [Phlyctochytrium arcticum]